MSTVHDVHSTVEGRYNRMDMQWDAEPMHNICDQPLDKLKSYLYSVPGDSHPRQRERERECTWASQRFKQDISFTLWDFFVDVAEAVFVIWLAALEPCGSGKPPEVFA